PSPPNSAESGPDDDPDHDQDRDPGEPHDLECATLTRTRAGLRCVLIDRRRGLPQEVVVALEPLGVVLDLSRFLFHRVHEAPLAAPTRGRAGFARAAVQHTLSGTLPFDSTRSDSIASFR